jgi:hypothetical protein
LLLDRRMIGGAAPKVSVSCDMQRQLTALVEQPSRATYLAARDAVLRLSPLPLAASDLAIVERLLDEQQFAEVLDRLDALPPSRVLSPRVHFLAAEAAAALGDHESIELERSLFVIVLQGLLATGDGTPANPYIVCHASDEYDVLETLGLEPAGQSLVEHGGGLCDVLTCSDGREVWFDVTDLLNRPARARKPAAKRRPKVRRRVSVSRSQR